MAFRGSDLPTSFVSVDFLWIPANRRPITGPGARSNFRVVASTVVFTTFSLGYSWFSAFVGSVLGRLWGLSVIVGAIIRRYDGYVCGLLFVFLVNCTMPFVLYRRGIGLFGILFSGL